jgi:hypothetical protein
MKKDDPNLFDGYVVFNWLFYSYMKKY